MLMFVSPIADAHPNFPTVDGGAEATREHVVVVQDSPAGKATSPAGTLYESTDVSVTVGAAPFTEVHS